MSATDAANRAQRQRSTDRAYDGVAQDFADRTESRSDVAADFFERFVGALSPSAIVADLGCGPGHDLRRLGEAGLRPIGLDRSLGLLGLCPDDAPTVRGDLMALPLHTGSLDGIWSSAALLHVDGDQLAPTFAEWRRVLAPGGVLGFATSLADGAHDQGWELVPAGPGRRPEIAPGDQRWFEHHRQDDLLQALADAGFDAGYTQVRASHRDWLQVIAEVAVPDLR